MSGSIDDHKHPLEHVQPPALPELSLGKKYAWLAIYFTFNLILTLFNKVVLGSFPFPYVLTSVHALCGTIGCFILNKQGAFTLSRLTDSEDITLLFFSFLYTINIAISNVSLKLVTVPFHQVIRATTPLFAMALNIVLYHSSYPLLTYMSLLLVVAGVGFATFGDYFFKPMGFFLTLLGAFLAALKTVVTNRIQTGRLRLSPLELLYRMSPLALAQTLVYAFLTGELNAIYKGVQAAWHPELLAVAADAATNAGAKTTPEFVLTQGLVIKLILNGLIAFGLNVVSFTANKNTGALTMTVAANIKQVMTIVLAIVFFHLQVNATNAFGIFLTLVGGAWYAKLELERKQTKQQSPSVLPSPATQKD